MGEIVPFQKTVFGRFREYVGLFATPPYLAEMCERMEKSLKLKAREGATPRQRLSIIARELEDIQDNTQEICNMLSVGDGENTLDQNLDSIADELENKMAVAEEGIGDVLDLLDRRILPAGDTLLRPKLEALHDGLVRYSFASEGSVRDFTEGRVINA